MGRLDGFISRTMETQMNARPFLFGLAIIAGISFAIGKAIALGCSIYVLLALLGLSFAVVVATFR